MLSSLKAALKNMRVSKVELAFIIFLLLFGIPMIGLIPPGAGYDEEDHLVRVWEMSALSFIPGEMSPQEMKYPVLFRDFAYRQQSSSGTLDAEFWRKYGRASLYEYGTVHRKIDTKSVYAPALLLPQALTLRILGRGLHLPALPVFYACRFASLLSYLLLVWLAIRQIPFGKWILLVLALTPMALFQAATLSPDAISNGLGFLFIAGCLRAAEFKEIGWREFGYLAFLIFGLFLAKLNLVPLILLPFLLLLPARFPKKSVYAALLGTTALFFVLEVAGWYLLASGHSDSPLANDANPGVQLRYLLGHPLAFPQIVLRDVFVNGWIYLQSWINGYGYYYWTPPKIVALLFVLSLVIVLWMNSTREQMDGKSRLVFLLMFALGYLATAGAEYTTFTPVGSSQIFGVQGRYFVPLALLLFLSLASFSRMTRTDGISPRWSMIFLGAALFLNLGGLFLSFHVSCGSTFYQTSLCYRPLFRDFSSETHISQPVSSERTFAQQIQVDCDGLSEVRLLAHPSASGDPGSTRFVLQSTSDARTLLDTSLANDQITTEDWYPLRFQPDWHSAGKQYLLQISGTGSKGLAFLQTSRSNFNPGTLYENGAPAEGDLIFQYGCTTGLRKIWPLGQASKP